MNKELTLVYLGRQGGGARLTRDIAFDLEKSRVHANVVYRENCEFADYFESLPGIKIPVSLPKSFLVMILLGHRFVTLIHKKIEQEFREPTNFVFIMPHPLNLKLLKKLSRTQKFYTTISIIHDDKAHKGELWPTRQTMKKIIKTSEKIIFLSHSVHQKFRNQSKFLVSQLESIPLVDKPNRSSQDNVIVVPGRIKKYKNISGVLRFAKQLSPKYRVKIVGKGRLPKRKTPSNVLIENNWIDALEFDRIIANSTALLSLYSEATQSGPIAIAKAYEVPVISNGVGGISEQLIDYQKKILIKDEKFDQDAFEQQLRLFLPSTIQQQIWPKMSITKLLLSNLEGELEKK